jgi:CubicO group peptidase (beta-lactamase class C family)
MNTVSPEKMGFAPDRLKRVDELMQGYVDAGKLAGMVTLIARADQVVHQETFGLRDLAASSPMESDTIFRIYSMTKPITSLAMMMLSEQGSVHLTDPVVKFLPEFEGVQVWEQDGKLVDPKRPIKVLDLLRHNAGLSYGGYKDSQDPVDELYDRADLFDSKLSLKEMVRRVADLPLIHHPGEAWRYSVATDVVGRLVEVISGKLLAEFFDRRIFAPLGMEDTAFQVPQEKMDRFATLYGRPDDEGLKPLDVSIGGDYVNPRLHLGGQGLVSTANDYLRFAQLLLNKGEWQGVRLLRRETVETMTSNQLPPAQIPISYNGIVDIPVPGIGFGLGFAVLMDPGQAGVQGSQGDYGWGGYAETYFWISPQEQLIAVLMAQSMPSLSYPIRNEFRTLVYQALDT